MRHYVDQVFGTNGTVVSGATVDIRVANATPGAGVLATIYSDDGITIKSNPVTTDVTGTFDFYAADGRYDLVAKLGGFTKIVGDIEIFDSTQANANDTTPDFTTIKLGITGDAGLCRLGPSTIGVGNGTAGNTGGALHLSALVQDPASGSFTINDPNSLSHFFISNASPYVNTFIQGNGAGGVFLGSTAKFFVDDLSGIYRMTGASSGTVIIQASAVASGTVTLPNGNDTIVARGSTDTLTNKRVSPRVVQAPDATSITPNADSADLSAIIDTQVAGTLTINAPTGTPTDGQLLRLRLNAFNNQTYSFNAIYRFSTSVTAPVTLTGGKTDYISLIFNLGATKWDVVSVDQGH